MEMILVVGAIVVGVAALVPFTLGLALYALLALSSWPFFLAVYFAAKSVLSGEFQRAAIIVVVGIVAQILYIQLVLRVQRSRLESQYQEDSR